MQHDSSVVRRLLFGAIMSISRMEIHDGVSQISSRDMSVYFRCGDGGMA